MWLLHSIFTIAMQRLFLRFASVHLIFCKKKRKKWHYLRIVGLLFDVTHSEYVMWLFLCIFAIVMQRLLFIFASVYIIFCKKNRKKWHFLRIVSLFFDVTHSEYVMWLLLSIFAIVIKRLFLRFASVHLIFCKKKRKKWHYLRIVSLLFDVTHSEYVMWLLLSIFAIVMQRLLLIFASVNLIFYKKKEKSDIFSELSVYYLMWHIVNMLCVYCFASPQLRCNDYS
jgi:hypothetical protein